MAFFDRLTICNKLIKETAYGVRISYDFQYDGKLDNYKGLMGVREGEISVLIGGKAGEGISSAGQVIAQILSHLGYRVHMYFDYPSLIKGGHNFAIIRGANRKIGSVRNSVDFLLALNQETIDHHQKKLTENGVIIFRADLAKPPEGVGVEVKKILSEEEAPSIMGNSAMLGAFVRVAGVDWEVAEAVFRKSIPKKIEKNLQVARKAYDTGVEKARIPHQSNPTQPVVTGNEAIGLGLIDGGLQVYCGYPMSPTSNLLHFLASHEEELHIRIFQPEGEIAVVLIALGCAYTGTRAAVGTSGGGFCLMTEALGLAGIAEIPIPIVIGQRPGPSTGLATYSAQSDLQFALGAGQGDFGRLIVAPGDAEEAITWAKACMDLSWKYQIPSLLLADKNFCEGLYSLDSAAIEKYEIVPVLGSTDTRPYQRYLLTESGISPMRFPPAAGEVIRVNSHVHDPDGITSEEEEVTRTMADKRMKKIHGLKEEIEMMQSVHIGGDETAATAILCWGSNKGICNEVGLKMHLRVIQPVVLWPFPEERFSQAMKGVDRVIAVENNESGQLAQLVRQFGYKVERKILKYDGRPFFIEELEMELREAIA